MGNPNAEAWLAVFYPESAGEIAKSLHSSTVPRAEQDRAVLAHSIRKWIGAQPGVLKSFGLDETPLFLDASTCSLCEIDAARRVAGERYCDKCVLAQSRGGVSCTRQWGLDEPSEGPFQASDPDATSDRAPMIDALLHAWRWLDKAAPQPEPEPVPPGRASRSFARFGHGDGPPSTQLKRLAACLAEAHADEMEAGHYGDAPEPGPWPAGCSYCHAISIAPDAAKATENESIALDGIARTLAENDFGPDLFEPLELIIESTGRKVPDLMAFDDDRRGSDGKEEGAR